MKNKELDDSAVDEVTSSLVRSINAIPTLDADMKLVLSVLARGHLNSLRRPPSEVDLDDLNRKLTRLSESRAEATFTSDSGQVTLHFSTKKLT